MGVSLPKWAVIKAFDIQHCKLQQWLCDLFSCIAHCTEMSVAQHMQPLDHVFYEIPSFKLAVAILETSPSCLPCNALHHLEKSGWSLWTERFLPHLSSIIHSLLVSLLLILPSTGIEIKHRQVSHDYYKTFLACGCIFGVLAKPRPRPLTPQGYNSSSS